MRIDKIVVLADKRAELQLHVFVRSLRDVGCKLPVWIIPFKARDFKPPAGSQWIDAGGSKLLAFLRQNAAHPLYCKYIALLQSHCAYFDTDIILLREPQEWLVLAPPDAFVVADTEWAKNRWTFSDDSLQFLEALSTCWQLLTFNSGFFAFENALYKEEELLAVIQKPEFRSTCLERKARPIDQPAINWLVLLKQRRVFNFNLPPQSMESTMAVDYGAAQPEKVLSNPAAPPFIHYAGPVFEAGLPVTELFVSYLTKSERIRWDAELRKRRESRRWLEKWPLFIRVLNRLIRYTDPRFHVQPKL
jgi:hypothetical protein